MFKFKHFHYTLDRIIICNRLSCFRYRHFLVLLVSSQTADDHLEWCGLVESKVRYLVGNLERNQHISLAHVNPKCFDRARQASLNGSITDANDRLVTAPFCSMWFIGMEFKKTENLNVDLTESIQNFTNLVHKHATSISLQKEGMEIEARHVRRKQLNVYLDKEILNRKSSDITVTTTTTTAAATNVSGSNAGSNKKRASTEVIQQTATQPQTQQNDPTQTIKRQRTNEYVSIMS